MNSITFKKTANIFVNAGIIGLYRFLQYYEIDHHGKFPSLSFQLSEQDLVVDCEEMLKLLEEVYYYMGGKVYDTPTKKQLDEKYNIYYVEEQGKFCRFPRMNTLGLSHLFTNNAQGVTRKKENSPKLKQLKKDKPELAQKIEQYYESLGLKPLSKVYLNEPYTKITRLEVHPKYLQSGDQLCPVTGERFKALVEAKNVSPFLSGLANFNSFLNSSEKKISWKALYLIRFSPVLCFFSYQNNYETLVCHFFCSNHLLNIERLHDASLFRQKEELEQINYQINFKLAAFSYGKKGADEVKVETTRDAVWPSEIAFMLLYTFYRDQFWKEVSARSKKAMEFIDPFADHPLEKVPITLVTFRADKFASTLRPNFYEEYNHVKFIIQLIFALEKEGVSVGTLWQSLKLNSPKAQILKKQDYGKGNALERKIRAEVLEKVLNGKSILIELEEMFFKCYQYLVAREQIGFRNYTVLEKFLLLYEKAINFGNQKDMNEMLQQRAINLGRSLSWGIINYDGPKNEEDKKANAKNGRKYIIRLHKARTLPQFTEALISIMKRYGTSVSNELLENLNEKNFITVRQYTVIGALNGINRILSPKKSED